MNEGASVCNATIGRVVVDCLVLVIVWEGCCVPSDDCFVAVGSEVEGEHLAVEVFANGYFVASFSVRDSKAICYFHLHQRVVSMVQYCNDVIGKNKK